MHIMFIAHIFSSFLSIATPTSLVSEFLFVQCPIHYTRFIDLLHNAGTLEAGLLENFVD